MHNTCTNIGNNAIGCNAQTEIEEACAEEPDVDEDGIPDATDNCPTEANPDQADFDEDGTGDACDNDADSDGFDNITDCDDMDSEVGEGTTWYADADGDLFGDENNSVVACMQSSGYVNNSDDCNDADATINPNATEIQGNGIDEVCDGFDAELPDDADGDGINDN